MAILEFVKKPSLEYTFNVYVVPAEDAPGQWVSHCLELDLVSQGDNPKHSVAMMMDAVTMVLEGSQYEYPPFKSTPAPPECWREYYSAPYRARLTINIEYKNERQQFAGFASEPELIASAG